MLTSALITGASTGIGRELAKLLAGEGYNLALVARDRPRLDSLAQELSGRHKILTRVLAKDLSRPESPGEIFEELRDFPISTLINNAGFGIYGRFAETDLAEELRLLQVNVAAVVQLTKLFLRPMLDRHEGQILNVASTAAYQPGPIFSTYYASKAFVHSFSVALALELRGTGVSVTTLCPGKTETEFQQRAKMEQTRLSSSPLIRAMSAKAVAETALRALHRGRPVVITGWQNKLTSALSKCSPAPLTARIAGKLNEKRHPPGSPRGLPKGIENGS